MDAEASAPPSAVMRWVPGLRLLRSYEPSWLRPDLIAGIVLWIFGTGAIRGFAVVLSLGIVTSMFTALLGSRALLTLMYGGARRPTQLSI